VGGSKSAEERQTGTIFAGVGGSDQEIHLEKMVDSLSLFGGWKSKVEESMKTHVYYIAHALF